MTACDDRVFVVWLASSGSDRFLFLGFGLPPPPGHAPWPLPPHPLTHPSTHPPQALSSVKSMLGEYSSAHYTDHADETVSISRHALAYSELLDTARALEVGQSSQDEEDFTLPGIQALLRGLAKLSPALTRPHVAMSLLRSCAAQLQAEAVATFEVRRGGAELALLAGVVGREGGAVGEGVEQEQGGEGDEEAVDVIDHDAGVVVPTTDHGVLQRVVNGEVVSLGVEDVETDGMAHVADALGCSAPQSAVVVPVASPADSSEQAVAVIVVRVFVCFLSRPCWAEKKKQGGGGGACVWRLTCHDPWAHVCSLVAPCAADPQQAISSEHPCIVVFERRRGIWRHHGGYFVQRV